MLEQHNQMKAYYIRGKIVALAEAVLAGELS